MAIPKSGKTFTKRHKFISSELAQVMFLAGQIKLLQVGQWIKGEDGKLSRILREDKEKWMIRLHPDAGVGTVCQRFLRAHKLKKSKVMDVVEPQSVALACEQMTEDDLRKLHATVSIMQNRINELEAEKHKKDYPHLYTMLSGETANVA